MGSLRFKGSKEKFIEIVAGLGITIIEMNEPNDGCFQLREEDGGTISFWPSKGTVHVQGKKPRVAELEGLLAPALNPKSSSSMAAKPSYASFPAPAASSPAASTEKRHIFIVHGHDAVARDQLELALLRLGLKPYILMNASAGSKTIIEALEGKIGKEFSSDFGIALFTPDDFGYSAKDGAAKAEPRARQNVVLETGMLLASLTRQRMAIIVKGHVDLPSDLSGVLQYRYNDHVKEIVAKLATQMKEAGVDIDTDKIADATA